MSVPPAPATSGEADRATDHAAGLAAIRLLRVLPSLALAGLLLACGGTAEDPSGAPTEWPADVAAAHTEDAALGGHSAAESEDDGSEALADTEAESEASDASEREPVSKGLGTQPYRDPMGICAELREPMARTLGLASTSLTPKAADVRDETLGVTLDGCQLLVESPGRDLLIGANHEDLPAFRMRRLLRNFGWRENIAYQKSEAGETTAGFERLNALCLVRVAFAPPKGVSCPESDPVTCGRSPLDLDYRIALRCALP